MKKLALTALATALSGALLAQNFTLTDDNTVINGDLSNLLKDWYIDGVDHLQNQNYYLGVAGMPEAPVSALGGATISQPLPNNAVVTFQNAMVSFQLTYTLLGGGMGSGSAIIMEVVRVRNKTNAPLSVSLFEYDDFDLNWNPNDDIGIYAGATTIRQQDGLGTVAVGTTPAFDKWEITTRPTLLNKLNDGVASSLSNTAPLVGPGNIEFATQWDRVLAPNQTFFMSKTKAVSVVPEPATMAALGLGLVALIRRRKK